MDLLIRKGSSCVGSRCCSLGAGAQRPPTPAESAKSGWSPGHDVGMDILTPEERQRLNQLRSAATHNPDLRDLVVMLDRITRRSEILKFVEHMMVEANVVEVCRVSKESADSDDELYPIPGEAAMFGAKVLNADHDIPLETVCKPHLADVLVPLFVCWCNGEPPCVSRCPEIEHSPIIRDPRPDDLVIARVM